MRLTDPVCHGLGKASIDPAYTPAGRAADLQRGGAFMHHRFVYLPLLMIAAIAGACSTPVDPGAELEVAAFEGNLEGVRDALAAGADPNEPSGSELATAQEPPICVAAAGIQAPGGSDGAEILRTLLEAGARVDDRTPSGWTALIRVANSSNSEAVDLLIKAGADVNAQGDDGKTALMAAAHTGNAENVKLLLVAGADLNIEDSQGRTALDYGSRHPAVMELIQGEVPAADDESSQ